MKNSELQELRTQDVADLQSQIVDLRRELLDGRIKSVTQGETPGMAKRRLRRQIARLLTIINEKKAAA